jgi:hypothetical protein
VSGGTSQARSALPNRTDARVFGAALKAGETAEYPLGKERHGYLMRPRRRPACCTLCVGLTVVDLVTDQADGTRIAASVLKAALSAVSKSRVMNPVSHCKANQRGEQR